MHHSKLLRTLRLLREPEMKRLAKFLKSPFYNANSHITDCYYYLRKYYPDFDSPKLNKQKVFQKLFPQRNYDHQKMLNLMYDFTALVEQFLTSQQLEKDKLVQQKLLLRALAGRGEGYPAFTKRYQEIQKLLEASPYRDASYFQEKFQLEQWYFNHPGTDKFKLTGAQYYQSMQHLEQYFVLEKLLLSCEMKSREEPLSEQHDIASPEDLFAGISDDYLGNPIAKAYVEMLYLLETGAEENYFQLKQLFQQNLTVYNRKLQQNILTSLLNFAIKRGNAGSAVYVKENFLLYKMGIEERLLFQKGKLNDRIYTNIALLAAKLKEFDWCAKFIVEEGNRLKETIQEDASTYCQAYLHYGKKENSIAIDYLQSIQFVNDFYQLGARVLLLRIYFEAFQKDSDFYDLLFLQSKSLEKYLRRNANISKQKKASHLEFVLTLRQMMKWKVKPDDKKEKAEKIKEEIQQKEIAYKNWLLEQLEQVV